MVEREQLYQQRLDRYTTAMRNEQPDRVPIRPFVAEFTGTYAGQYVPTDVGERPPGVCVPWREKRASLRSIQGDEALCQRIWQSIDSLAAMYIWWIALAF